jgi:hypothetical protein
MPTRQAERATVETSSSLPSGRPLSLLMHETPVISEERNQLSSAELPHKIHRPKTLIQEQAPGSSLLYRRGVRHQATHPSDKYSAD